MRVDLLHLMCRSHVQSGTPQLNDTFLSLTPKHPQQPRCSMLLYMQNQMQQIHVQRFDLRLTWRVASSRPKY